MHKPAGGDVLKRNEHEVPRKELDGVIDVVRQHSKGAGGPDATVPRACPEEQRLYS
jgi:hypothetical protein